MGRYRVRRQRLGGMPRGRQLSVTRSFTCRNCDMEVSADASACPRCRTNLALDPPLEQRVRLKKETISPGEYARPLSIGLLAGMIVVLIGLALGSSHALVALICVSAVIAGLAMIVGGGMTLQGAVIGLPVAAAAVLLVALGRV